MTNTLAQFGNIVNPFAKLAPTRASLQLSGGRSLIVLFNNLLKTAIIIAGLFSLINFVLAGYQFLSAGGDQKAVAKAWEKIWMSLIGLVVVSGALVLAGVFGYIIFGDATIFINPQVFEPSVTAP